MDNIDEKVIEEIDSIRTLLTLMNYNNKTAVKKSNEYHLDFSFTGGRGVLYYRKKSLLMRINYLGGRKNDDFNTQSYEMMKLVFEKVKKMI